MIYTKGCSYVCAYTHACIYRYIHTHIFCIYHCNYWVCFACRATPALWQQHSCLWARGGLSPRPATGSRPAAVAQGPRPWGAALPAGLGVRLGARKVAGGRGSPDLAEARWTCKLTSSRTCRTRRGPLLPDTCGHLKLPQDRHVLWQPKAMKWHGSYLLPASWIIY